MDRRRRRRESNRDSRKERWERERDSLPIDFLVWTGHCGLTAFQLGRLFTCLYTHRWYSLELFFPFSSSSSSFESFVRWVAVRRTRIGRIRIETLAPRYTPISLRSALTHPPMPMTTRRTKDDQRTKTTDANRRAFLIPPVQKKFRPVTRDFSTHRQEKLNVTTTDQQFFQS